MTNLIVDIISSMHILYFRDTVIYGDRLILLHYPYWQPSGKGNMKQEVAYE